MGAVTRLLLELALNVSSAFLMSVIWNVFLVWLSSSFNEVVNEMCSLLYGAEDPSIAGMVLDSAFSNLFDLMMELVDVYKIRLPKFTVCSLFPPSHILHCLYLHMATRVQEDSSLSYPFQ